MSILAFSASESAFLGLNKLRVHFLREKGEKRAVRAGKLLERKEELLNMLLLGNEIVNVALSVILTSIFLKLLFIFLLNLKMCIDKRLSSNWLTEMYNCSVNGLG